MTYDPDKTYRFDFTENELSVLEFVIETYMEFQKETLPEHMKRGSFLSEETKLLRRFYEVTDACTNEYHAQVENDMFHESLTEQLNEYKRKHGDRGFE